MRKFFEGLAGRAEWPRWPANPNNVTNKECGCVVMQEAFGPRYYWYGPMRWWMDSFTGSGVEKPEPVSRIHWPLAFMFAVDKDTVLRHSRSYYAAMHRLAHQGINLLHDIKVGPGSLGDGFEMVYNPDTLGHALERLPFLVLADRSADAPKPYALCRPRCSSAAPMCSEEPPGSSGTEIRLGIVLLSRLLNFVMAPPDLPTCKFMFGRLI